MIDPLALDSRMQHVVRGCAEVATVQISECSCRSDV
jgi:hypothetical protein